MQPIRDYECICYSATRRATIKLRRTADQRAANQLLVSGFMCLCDGSAVESDAISLTHLASALRVFDLLCTQAHERCPFPIAEALLLHRLYSKSHESEAVVSREVLYRMLCGFGDEETISDPCATLCASVGGFGQTPDSAIQRLCGALGHVPVNVEEFPFEEHSPEASWKGPCLAIRNVCHTACLMYPRPPSSLAELFLHNLPSPPVTDHLTVWNSVPTVCAAFFLGNGAVPNLQPEAVAGLSSELHSETDHVPPLNLSLLATASLTCATRIASQLVASSSRANLISAFCSIVVHKFGGSFTPESLARFFEKVFFSLKESSFCLVNTEDANTQAATCAAPWWPFPLSDAKQIALLCEVGQVNSNVSSAAFLSAFMVDDSVPSPSLEKILDLGEDVGPWRFSLVQLIASAIISVIDDPSYCFVTNPVLSPLERRSAAPHRCGDFLGFTGPLQPFGCFVPFAGSDAIDSAASPKSINALLRPCHSKYPLGVLSAVVHARARDLLRGEPFVASVQEGDRTIMKPISLTLRSDSMFPAPTLFAAAEETIGCASTRHSIQLSQRRVSLSRSLMQGSSIKRIPLLPAILAWEVRKAIELQHSSQKGLLPRLQHAAQIGQSTCGFDVSVLQRIGEVSARIRRSEQEMEKEAIQQVALRQLLMTCSALVDATQTSNAAEAQEGQDYQVALREVQRLLSEEQQLLQDIEEASEEHKEQLQARPVLQEMQNELSSKLDHAKLHASEAVSSLRQARQKELDEYASFLQAQMAITLHRSSQNKLATAARVDALKNDQVDLVRKKWTDANMSLKLSVAELQSKCKRLEEALLEEQLSLVGKWHHRRAWSSTKPETKSRHTNQHTGAIVLVDLIEGKTALMAAMTTFTAQDSSTKLTSIGRSTGIISLPIGGDTEAKVALSVE